MSDLSPSVIAMLFELEKQFNKCHRNNPEGDPELWKEIRKVLILHKEK